MFYKQIIKLKNHIILYLIVLYQPIKINRWHYTYKKTKNYKFIDT